MDVVCQAKSGMGKTAVFVIATLQQLEPVDSQVSVLVMCHTRCACVCDLTSALSAFLHMVLLSLRELAFQIYKEYERFSKYFDNIKTAVFFGGISIKKDEEVMKTNCPHIVVGTPGRILALIRDKTLNLKHIKHFILDECDKMLEQLGGLPVAAPPLPSLRVSSLSPTTFLPPQTCVVMFRRCSK